MLARKKVSENASLLGQTMGQKKGVAEIPGKGVQTKPRKSTISQTKRAAFGDLTNATTKLITDDGKKKTIVPTKPAVKANLTTICNKTNKIAVKKKPEVKSKTVSQATSSNNSHLPLPLRNSVQTASRLNPSHCAPALKIVPEPAPLDRVEEDFSFVIVEDTETDPVVASKSEGPEEAEKSLLAVDQENYTDVFSVGIYAQDIFDYYKRREKLFRIPAYLNEKRCRITPAMRAILVDWMVEVQENFEFNHETLYLAVKLTDLYLSRVSIEVEMLQLVGASAVFIASKFDERCPPLIEDFTYICDNAFDREQFVAIEMEVLRTVDFDLGIPISYSFLRRYAKVARMSIETLTLARYILEMSLMEHEFIVARDSLLAAAALYIAQKMKREGSWEGDVIKSSGYTVQDIKDLVVLLNKMLHARPIPQLTTIRSKYSHEVFHEVAKIAPLPTEELL